MVVTTRPVRALAALALCSLAALSAATEITYLALPGPGQGSVTIDDERHRAFVLDLGSAAAEEELTIEGRPLLDHLEQRGVRELFLTCSHPHEDHLGGLRRLVENPALFARRDARGVPRPRFDRLVMVDAYDVAAKDSLSALFEIARGKLPADLNRALPRVETVPAVGRNAFAPYSKSADGIFVRTIPHDDAGAGPHGRSVITATIIDHTVTVLDTDDATTPIVRQVAAYLEKAGVTGKLVVVLPHHGSRHTDIRPLLALKPADVVIAVNPLSSYLHPGLENVERALRAVGREHIHFTGSERHVVITKESVGTQPDHRGDFDNFIAPQLLIARLKGKDPRPIRDGVNRIATLLLDGPLVPLPEGGYASLAERLDVTVSSLKRLNGEERLFVEGSLVSVPIRGKHVVVAGESLERIARAYGTTAQAMATVNGRSRAAALNAGKVLAIADCPAQQVSAPPGSLRVFDNRDEVASARRRLEANVRVGRWGVLKAGQRRVLTTASGEEIGTVVSNADGLAVAWNEGGRPVRVSVPLTAGPLAAALAIADAAQHLGFASVETSAVLQRHFLSRPDVALAIASHAGLAWDELEKALERDPEVAARWRALTPPQAETAAEVLGQFWFENLDLHAPFARRRDDGRVREAAEHPLLAVEYRKARADLVEARRWGWEPPRRSGLDLLPFTRRGQTSLEDDVRSMQRSLVERQQEQLNRALRSSPFQSGSTQRQKEREKERVMEAPRPRSGRR